MRLYSFFMALYACSLLGVGFFRSLFLSLFTLFLAVKISYEIQGFLGLVNKSACLVMVRLSIMD